jgi:hypothetical protein
VFQQLKPVSMTKRLRDCGKVLVDRLFRPGADTACPGYIIQQID